MNCFSRSHLKQSALSTPALCFALAISFGLGTSASAYADEQAGAVKLVSSAPFAADNDIRKKITNNCTTLGAKLSSFTQSFAEKNGVVVQLVDSVDTAAAGRVLELEIDQAVSQGNAFIGHRKFVGVRGTLWEDGQRVATFDGERSSGGGFAAGYKSSCAVLGRCVKALGKDIAAWLENPVDEAEIGE